MVKPFTLVKMGPPLLFLGVITLFLVCVKISDTSPGLQLQERIRTVEFIRERRLKNAIDAEVIPKFPLPSSLQPVNYNIQIMPILDNYPEIGPQFSAPGRVRILVNCLQNTSVITLHSFLLQILNETVQIIETETGNPVPVLSQQYDEEKHFYHIYLGEGLADGNQYEIILSYIAPVSTDRTNGLYLTTYIDPASGDRRYVAATQLEPARARQVFPSFDEPRWKPTFDVTIGRRVNYSSLCNSPLVNTRPHETLPDWFWDEYNTTVPMPAYLFAMAVSDFQFAEANSSLYRVPVRTYAPAHLILNGAANYSAEASALIINFFERLYGSDYPMPKVDSILVPGKGGAMENYGLITYGDFLMYDEYENTEDQRQRLVSVISHELAHQWFGNLVTCVSWSHIYLNEGFATYVSFIGEEPFYNEYFPRKYILNDAVQDAFILDAGPTSHPLVVEDIYTIPAISAHFSNLQYQKGASLIRMMEGFLTEEVLNEALRKYIKLKLHDVAEQDDLFGVLDDEVNGTMPDGLTVKEVMDTWTLQNGFPLVRVSIWNENNVLFSQEKFVNRDEIIVDEDSLWEIPITFATESQPNFQNYTPATWIHKDVVAKIFSHNSSEWIMINLDGMNFHRVLYDNRLTEMILQQLRENLSIISPLSRSQFLDDYFNLAWQGYVNIETALSVTESLLQEDDFTVWNAFFFNFRSSFQLLSQSEAEQATSAYLLPRVDAALQSIGLIQDPGDKGALVLLRSQLLDWACAMGHQDCQQYAKSLLQLWQQNPTMRSPFPLDLQPILYCSVIANGTAVTFNFFLEKYRNETSDTHKSRLARALGCVTTNSSVDELLYISLDGSSGFSKSDSAAILIGLAGNPNAQAQVFGFLDTQINEIINFYGNAVPIASVISVYSSYFSTTQQLDQVLRYIADHAEALTDVQAIIDASVSTIENNILWRLRYFDAIKNWLETAK